MGPKRKRTTDLGGNRPAPHRPSDSNLGQHDRSRAAVGGRSTRRNDRRDSGLSSSVPGPASPLNSPTLPRPSSASSQSAIAPSANKAPEMPSSVSPSPLQSGYHYDIVTDGRLGSWAQGGRQELIEHGIQSRNDEDIQELSTIFQELLQSCLDYRLKASQAGEAVKEIVGSRSEDADKNFRTFDPHTLFLDTVSVYLDVESGSYNPSLREFMISTGIDPSLMRRVLEPALLEPLGLIRDTFTRAGIRQATNILYKQANYNLLREETEGYAKLATEIFQICNEMPPSAATIHDTFEKVKGLIGTFDLDVGRVLDVLLDVFASVLVKQNRFFVRFLRVSSWWPRNNAKSMSTFVGGLPKWALPESEHWQTSDEDEEELRKQRLQRDIHFWDRAREVHLNAYFELGGRQLHGPELQRLRAVLGANDEAVDDISHLGAEMQWMVATKTLPPQGNRVAAQLLGFKLRFYDSDFKDEADVLPANLFYLTALLIKIGFISLADLWPHVGPSDDDMEKHRKQRMEKLQEEARKKTGAASNALALAAELPEEGAPPVPKPKPDPRSTPSAAAADKKEDDERIQKVILLRELLTIGAIPESLFILSQYPWLPEAHPDLVKLINRLISYSVQKVFLETKSGLEGSAAPIKRLPDIDQSGVVKGSVRLGQTQSKRPFKWPYPDGEQNNSPYRFYWDDWADNIPVCQTVEDIFTLCGTLVNLSGVNIGRDPALLTKLAAIGAMSLAQDQSPENMSRWQELLTRHLVPALSLIEANSFAVHAVWDLLKLFPITTRYGIYSEWFLGRTSRLPAIRSAFAHTRSETNSVLKRLSLQNLSAMARKLAKTTFSSPGVVFKTAFDQIEAYPNLIQAFVECARYFTDLGYDVLTWSLMSALGGKSRSRTQEASVLLTSKWLQALSKFSGRVFKRYQHMKPSPVLQYVNSQLLRGNSTDLVILRELISTMAGVVPDVDFTDAQLRAMTGGDVLRRETLIKLGDRRFDSVSGAKRLMQSLVDTKLAGRLLINLAQYRQSSLYKEDAHVKYLATIMDEVHQALAQYLDLLRSNLSPEEFDTIIPGVAELMAEYGLDVQLAFMIGRASLAYRMANTKTIGPYVAKDASTTSQVVQESTDTDCDLLMNGNSTESMPEKSSPGKEETEDKMAVDEKPSAETLGASLNPSETRKPDPVADVLQPLVDTIQDMMPSETWRNLSPEFYVTFWSLSLGDLHVPQASYESEHDRLFKEAENVMKDRSDMTRQGMNKKDEKKKSLQGLGKSIRQEMARHIERYQKMKFRLARQAKFWFSGSAHEANLVADSILEHCILPRLLVSALDTEYCFRLVKFLHENQTPNFKLFALYEQFFNANRLRVMIFSCTVREAEYLGRFIRCILEDLAGWHADKALYEKEAFGSKRRHLGFATAFDEEGNPTTFVEHPFFRDAHYEWHKNLNMALKACLQGTTEWMHIRNAITVLRYVSNYFPAVNFMGTQLLKVLDDIKTREEASKGSSEEGHRVDLAVTAQTVYSLLKKREAKWIPVQAFRPNMVRNICLTEQVSSMTNNTKSGMPHDGPKDVEMNAPAANSNLRPTAQEFKPQQAKSVSTLFPTTPIKAQSLTQSSTAMPVQPVEEEDGEVKDGKDSKTSNQNDQSKAETTTSKALNQDKDSPKDSIPKDRVATQGSRPATPRPVVAVVTPQSSSAASVGRNDNSRPGATSSRSDRTPHGLPSRPDVPFPDHFRGQHFGIEERRESPRGAREQKPSREVREPRDHPREPRDVPRETRDLREHRQQDTSRGDRRDYHGAERRVNENIPREPSRLPERDWPSRGDPTGRHGEISAVDRDTRPPRDRGQTSGRDSRGPRDGPVLPPQSQPTAPQNLAEEPLINPERAALLQSDDRAEFINPARAAMMHNTQPHSSRSPRDSGRDRTSSRTSSPRREDRYSAGMSGGHTREDRHTRRTGHIAEQPPPPARDNDQARDQDRQTSDRARDVPHQGPQSRSHDPERNRHNQQDPNYGRLNPIPSLADTLPQGPPQGPRGRGARNSVRLSSMPTAPRPDGRMPPPDINRAQSPDRQPPTGPSSSRARRTQSNQYEQSANSGNGGSQVQGGGIHPDRMKQFETSATQVPVHPDRMNHIVPPPPPGPPPGPSSRSRPNVAPIHTNDRVPPTGPSGSRQGQNSLPNTPVAESNAPYSVPTGPSATQDRQRGSARRHLENLQNSITPNRREGDPRRQRANLPDSDAQVLTGISPVSTPTLERLDPMRRNPIPERAALSNDVNGFPPRDSSRSGPYGDDFSSSRSEAERSGRREHRERSDRSSRHGARERTPRGDRDAKDPRTEHHERHERRSGAPSMPELNRDRDPNHEPIQPRRSTRDSVINSSNRDPMTGGGKEPSTSGRESRHRGDGRSDNSRIDNNRSEISRGDGVTGGRQGEEWGNAGRGGSMRGGLRDGPRDVGSGRLGDDRREHRSDDRMSSRKRRSDVSEMPPNDRDKRMRR